MSDDDADEGPNDDQRTIGNEARTKMIEAIGDWTSQWGEEYEGGIVTGYVVIAEVTRPGENPFSTWLTGSGATPTDSDRAALVTHRVEGLVRVVLRDIMKGSVQ